MQCAKCGSSIAPGLDQCPACGSFVDATASGVPFLPGAYGIPAAHFTPSLQGPPSSRDPYATAPRIHAPHMVRGYRTVELPPHFAYKKQRQGVLRRILPLAALGAVVLCSILVLTSHAVPTRSTTTVTRQGGHAFVPMTTALPTSMLSACHSAVPDQAAARMLTQIQFTSRLRNAAKDDFRPTDKITATRAGRTLYLTFRIATSATGIAAVTFCLPQAQIPDSLAIPARSQGHYAQFTLEIPQDTSGQGVAVLTWNDQTVAVMQFTVEA